MPLKGMGVGVLTRVRTDPGKVWKIFWEIFKALKSLESDHR